MSSILFKLYVAGRTTRSQRAVANLRRLAETEFAGRCEYLVIDVMEDPQAAEEDRILTTPTLIKVAPAPQRRVTGDLSDPAMVMYALALDGAAPSDPGMGGDR